MSEEENEEQKGNEEEEKEEKEEGEEAEEEKKENEPEDKKKKKDKKKKDEKKDEKKKAIKKEKIKSILKNNDNEVKNQVQLNESKENKQKVVTNSNSENNNITSAFPFTLSTNRNNNPLQLLSTINNEMDNLSNTLKTNFAIYSSPSTFNHFEFNTNINYTSPILSNNYNNYYDKEDFEIKELLIKANKLINDNEYNMKFKNNLNINNLGKKFENKITQSDDINFKYYANNNQNNLFPKNTNNSNNSNVNLNNNNNFNTNTNFYENRNNNFNNFYNDNNNMNNKYINTRKSDLSIDQDFYRINNNNRDYNQIENNFNSRERKHKSINNHIRLNRKDFMNNDNNEEMNNNVIFKKFQDFDISSSQKNEVNSIDNSINNRTKKIEDLYKFTNNPRRRPIIYTQPESRPLNNILSSRVGQGTNKENNSKNNDKKYSTIRDNGNYFNKNSYLRFDNEGVNIAMDILNGKI